jgi:hypothetical protein
MSQAIEKFMSKLTKKQQHTVDKIFQEMSRLNIEQAKRHALEELLKTETEKSYEDYEKLAQTISELRKVATNALLIELLCLQMLWNIAFLHKLLTTGKYNAPDRSATLSENLRKLFTPVLAKYIELYNEHLEIKYQFSTFEEIANFVNCAAQSILKDPCSGPIAVIQATQDLSCDARELLTGVSVVLVYAMAGAFIGGMIGVFVGGAGMGVGIVIGTFIGLMAAALYYLYKYSKEINSAAEQSRAIQKGAGQKEEMQQLKSLFFKVQKDIDTEKSEGSSNFYSIIRGFESWCG